MANSSLPLSISLLALSIPPPPPPPFSSHHPPSPLLPISFPLPPFLFLPLPSSSLLLFSLFLISFFLSPSIQTYNRAAEEYNKMALADFKKREADAIKKGILSPKTPKKGKKKSSTVKRATKKSKTAKKPKKATSM